MELNLETKQQLEKLLAKPSLVAPEHTSFLQHLVNAYPYYQPLHLLLAKANSGSSNQNQAYATAAMYNNGYLLHAIINEPQKLTGLESSNVIYHQPWRADIDFAVPVEEPQVIENNYRDMGATDAPSMEAPEIENLPPLHSEVIASENITDKELPLPFVFEHMETPMAQNNDFALPEIENLPPLAEEILKVCAEEEVQEASAETIQESDEQEIFEEINELVVPEEPIANEEKDTFTFEHHFSPIEENITDAEITANSTADKIEEDDFIVESIAAIDFFAFDKNFSSEPIEETLTAPVEEEEALEIIPDTEESKENIVSRYNDDKMPFTFLWWLAKTRKDHEQLFRPFASPVKPSSPTENLQQQYVEHIFHLQSPFEPGAKPEEAQSAKKPNKESELIDNFIKNEPQIKAPKPDQINNENKAKKSAEDNYDLVSETLAEIYIEQMLYHKAIDTYQKLSLKFPEKSRYFADLILSLEKKI